MPAASAEDVNRAVEAAREALDSTAWRGLTATARGRLLHRLADLVQDNASRLAELETRDTATDSRDLGAGCLCSGVLSILRRRGRQTGGPGPAHRQARHGGVAAPRAHRCGRSHRTVELAAVPVGGQARPGPGGRMHGGAQGVRGRPGADARIRETDRRGRLPAGGGEYRDRVRAGLWSIPDFAPAGQSHRVHRWNPHTARHIVRNSADNLAHTTLELGGKSPVVVFEDADLASAANAVVAGVFAATGQQIAWPAPAWWSNGA